MPTNSTELDNINSEVDALLYQEDNSLCNVTPKIIGKCITSLKKNKSDGNKGFNSNHLIYGPLRLKVLLSMLFHSMLAHGYYPNELLKSNIISIPKDRTASLSNSDNYRGISLFNSICKLYDYVIIELCKDSFSTSEMQFGFKEKHSTTMCTVILREVIQNYIEGHSNVYCCLLDASKAFDKVHYGKLFTILLAKNVSPYVIRLLIDSYVRQQACVSWNGFKSNYFILQNGVKQGGVLSPILFTMYIDNLLIKLKQSGYGCHVDNVFMGALSYADDITLLSPSLHGLNRMLEICAKFADNFDITFNSKKTLCIKFGESLNGKECAKLNNKIIKWVDHIKHLGNFLDSTLSDKLDTRSKISAFIGYVNKVKANFGHLQMYVLCKLFKIYCCSFYGSQMWKINSLYFKNVCICWNKAVRRILNVPYTTHTWMLGPILNQTHISTQLIKRCIRFLFGMASSHNIIVYTCYNNAIGNANTPMGSNIAYFRDKYGIELNSLSKNITNLVSEPKLNTEQLIAIQHLRDLLDIQNNVCTLDNFSVEDIDMLIREVATR